MLKNSWLILLTASLLTTLFGCGSGGGGNPRDQLAGNIAGTWRNTAKGLSGTLTGTYSVEYVEETVLPPPGGSGGGSKQTVRVTKFEAVFKDSNGQVVFEAGDNDRVPITGSHGGGGNGFVALPLNGATVATGVGVQHPVNTPYTQAIFTADSGVGIYAGSKFEADLIKVP